MSSSTNSSTSLNSTLEPSRINNTNVALSNTNIDRFLNEDLSTSQCQLQDSYDGSTIVPRSQSSPVIANNVEIINNLSDAINHLNNAICTLKVENRELKAEIGQLREEVWDSWDSIYYIEKDLSQFQQYNRRENVEIMGIPDSVKDNELEKTVVDILRRINVYNLDHFEIVGCHRLKKHKRDQPANVIIRFVNRRRAYQCIENRRLLKSEIPEFPNLYIVENLCPKYKSIFDKCQKLRSEGKIKHLWTYNGIVHYKTLNNTNERGKKIYHISELEERFPNI